MQKEPSVNNMKLKPISNFIIVLVCIFALVDFDEASGSPEPDHQPHLSLADLFEAQLQEWKDFFRPNLLWCGVGNRAPSRDVVR